MKSPASPVIINTVTTIFTALTILLFSCTSFAHSDRSTNYHHKKTYFIAKKNGLARNYFNYSYDQRRAKKLAKYYRTQKRTRRYQYLYDGCPYTGHNH